MLSIRRFFLISTIAICVAPIQIPAQESSLSPAEQFQNLQKDHQRASSSGVALTDEARLAFIGKVFQHRYELGKKFLELAQANPQDPIAFDALVQAVWQVNTTPWPAELVGPEPARAQAFAILQRDHIQSDKLGPLCQRVSFGYCQEYETFLREVLKSNPHRDVQGVASLALAQFLNNRLQRLALIEGHPKLTKEFSDLFGLVYLQELVATRLKNSPDPLAEIEALLEQAAEIYRDVKTPNGDTVGAKASAALFEIRHLLVGKVAPDIEGQDQDGVPFKLSDYRGKVVLLDFWHQQ
jgi:hypothetical protein